MIQVLMTLLIDVTGVVEDMFTPIVKFLTGSRVGTVGKPFSCSLCCTVWTCLIYLIVVGAFNLPNLLITMVLACTTDITLALFHFTKDLIVGAIEAISNIFGL